MSQPEHIQLADPLTVFVELGGDPAFALSLARAIIRYQDLLEELKER